ncbi:50S ribosomal protein L4P [Acidilobus saccharovorans 345-15]|uniref:Large ribosomal subunit protein uL4 n=1 Tax=Acidilobus saccharovorans (strain DSM 16705 / JCM 18335 / VKM B-2471 / 345-15) TaxID=666510 RepID=D9Q202_ACIS3|nr:50S ribosomal protein L4 [Acidilobus saccharovorans]ADL19340.1 50S ribosomal protein L4P [Acidilobus saccharovorans 345-15]
MSRVSLGFLLYMNPPISVPKYDAEGKEAGEVQLPDVFRVPVRRDLIHRVFMSEFTAALQPKGRDPMAGKRTTAVSLGIHHGLARVPRIRGSTRARLAPFVRGGRRAFPPTVEKKIKEDVNRTERILGTMSALAATAIPELVRDRGHVFSATATPIILDSSVSEAVKRTSDARELLSKIGVYSDIERAYEGTRIRAGKGKMRGRRYVTPVSILFIVDDIDSPFARSVRGFPGVDVVEPQLVSVLELAPGGEPGRLTVITSNALNALAERFKVGGELS